MYVLPPNAPANLYEAFAFIGSVRNPTLDDIKLMMLLEAAGKTMYDALAEDAPNEEARRLLLESGCDEYLHAERMAQIVGLLTDEPCSVPAPAENPYLVDWQKPRLTVELLEKLAAAEDNGGALYECWAQSCANAEAAGLMRLCGREEATHSERMRKIIGCLK